MRELRSQTPSLDEAELHDRVRLLMQQALLGLGHLHEHRVVHKDIKPHNLLLMTDGRVVLTDFEFSRVQAAPGDTVMASTIGRGSYTPGYAAPEVERNEGAISASDIFSLGVTLYQLRHGKMPEQHAGAAWDGQPLNHIPASGGPLDDLLRQMLQPEPAHRPTAHECLLHAYFCSSEAVRARVAGELQVSLLAINSYAILMHAPSRPSLATEHEALGQRALRPELEP